MCTELASKRNVRDFIRVWIVIFHVYLYLSPCIDLSIHLSYLISLSSPLAFFFFYNFFFSFFFINFSSFYNRTTEKKRSLFQKTQCGTFSYTLRMLCIVYYHHYSPAFSMSIFFHHTFYHSHTLTLYLSSLSLHHYLSSSSPCSHCHTRYSCSEHYSSKFETKKCLSHGPQHVSSSSSSSPS